MLTQCFRKKLITIATLCCVSISLMIIFPAPSYGGTLCKFINEQEFCLSDIKRSAKNYWEYRLKVKIDGKSTVALVYDCSDRKLIKPSPAKLSFDSQPVGNWICKLF